MRRLLNRRKKPKAEAVNQPSFQDVGQSSEPEDLTVLSTETSSESPSQDLWDRAYKLLRHDRGSHKVIETYEKVLLSLLKDEDDSPTGFLAGLDKERQLSQLIAKRLKLIEEARWKFDVGNQTIELKAQVDRIVKTVVFAKDFVSSAVSSDPHAALAWAGVCVLMPLLLNPSTQQQALIKGLDLISDIICRYKVVEVAHRQQKAEAPTPQPGSMPLDEASESLDAQVTKLYSKVLRYQAQVVCQLLRPAMIQYARDVFKADDWAELLAEIGDIDSACQKLISVIDSGRLKNGFEEQAWKMDNLENTLRLELIQIHQANIEVAQEIHNVRLQEQGWHQSAEESKCLQALYRCDYKAQKARNPNRVPGTCQWLLRNENFRHWLESTSSDLLWVTADPGCGKSVLSKSLIDNELRSRSSSVTAYFFFKDDNHDQRRVTMALCALLHQILVQSGPELQRKAVQVFESHGSQLTDSFTVLWDLLLEVSRDPIAGQIVCIVDALDECEEAGRESLIDSLNAFNATTAPYTTEGSASRLKFLVTSRPYHDIRHRFDSKVVRLAGEEESELVKQEIDLVIRHRVPQVASQLSLDAKTQNVLQQRLMNAENRTYLWLHLILEDILKRSVSVQTPKKLERFMNELPTSIYEAYDHMLKRSPDHRIARKLLHIILAAVRPLTLREMNMALNIEEGQISREEVDLDPEDGLAERIRNHCGLFVFVNRVDSKIYLIHQTAKEFLVGPETIGRDVDRGNPSSDAWKHSMDPGVSNYVITQICINYLLFSIFEIEPLRSETERSRRFEGTDDLYETKIAIRTRILPYTDTHELLDYAARHWAFHFRNARIDHALLVGWASVCKTTAARFDTWFRIYWHEAGIDGLIPYARDYESQLPPLVLASILGHPVIVDQVSGGMEPELKEIHGRMALWWAAIKGDESVMRQLLEKDLSDITMFRVRLPKSSELADRPTEFIEYGTLNDEQRWLVGHKYCPWKESKPMVDMLIASGANVRYREATVAGMSWEEFTLFSDDFRRF